MKYFWFIFILTSFLPGRTIETYPNQVGELGFLKLSEYNKLHSNVAGIYTSKPRLHFANKISQDKGKNVGSSIVKFGNPGIEDLDAALRFEAVQPSLRENKNGIYAGNTKLTLLKDIKQPDIAAHYYSLALQGSVIVGGAIFWKYTERWTGNFEIDNEGFFRGDSDNGGADKLGHAYAWNLLTRGLISIYDRHGFSRNESIFWGITIPTMNGILVELLDGYTTNGASLEDILFNLIGSGSAALLYLNPAMDETFHLDWSYWPSRELPLEPVENDITTDYSGQMFTLEMNFAGLKRLINLNTPPVLDHFQLGLSYYTRGYRGTSILKEERFAGITFGINFQELFREDSWLRPLAKYYKLPFSFIGVFQNLETKQYEFKIGMQVFAY